MTGDGDWPELLVRIAAERGIDFEPMPATVAHVLPPLADAVTMAVSQLAQPHELRWVAAALAALSHHTQAAAHETAVLAALASSADPRRRHPSQGDPDQVGDPGQGEPRRDGPRQGGDEMVVVAVVTSHYGCWPGSAATESRAGPCPAARSQWGSPWRRRWYARSPRSAA